MPLDPDAEECTVDVDGFNDAVPASRGDGEAGANTVDRLVVVDVSNDRVGTTEGRGQRAVRGNAHRFLCERPPAQLVTIVSDNVRQVLVKGSSPENVEHL